MFLRLFAIAVFILTVGPALPGHANDFADRFVSVNPPRPMPPLTFNDDKGNTHDLKEYHGRYVLLNLWATWCMPCVNEMPALNNLQDKFDYRELNIIALNEDRNGVAAAKSFVERHNLKRLPVYVDSSGQAPSILHAHGLPTTFLIDPNGMDIGHIEGEADWMDPQTIAFLKSKMSL